MDNLSHSLTGLAAGELIHRSLPQEPEEGLQRIRRRLLLVSCWLASNFPDLDILLSRLLPKPLGYLLHHRGHTHTILFAVLLALLLTGVICLLWPAARRLLENSRSARLGMALAMIVGFGLHLAMDYLNNYGVHPFHPFDSRWFYGDMVFIVEPMFWIAFGVPLIMCIARHTIKWPLLAGLLAVPAYSAGKGFLAWGSLAALLLIALFLAVIQSKAGQRGKAAFVCAILIMLAFLGIQGAASGISRGVVEAHLNRIDPDSRVADVALTAYPSHPLCWTFVSLETKEAADTYRLRRGHLSLVPGWVPVSTCPPAFSEVAEDLNLDPAIVFAEEETGSISWLRTLSITNCHFEAWLRFARMPLVKNTTATDFRFGGGPKGNFTTIDLKYLGESKCSPYAPTWDMPREDLLGPSESLARFHNF
ncbi:MAG: metal-dependent hydrolase [Burkholderiales bacterium]|nr:metal-dependent hydrolase [Burkholderiales bacterium]